MHVIVVDVNVLVEEAQTQHASKQVDESRNLITLMKQREIPVCLTPTMLKDLQYLIAARTKTFLRNEKGTLDYADVVFSNQLALSKLDWYLDNATIMSETLIDCRMARSMMKVHKDFEDNLITAVAMRAEAKGIVTRDEKFSKECQVKCYTPAQAIQFIESNAWV